MQHSLIIPACNEAQRIRKTLRAYLPTLQPGRDELIVVVNGSRDDTERILREEFQPQCPAMRVVVIPARVGKGGALMRGFSESRGQIIAFTDADGSTPPEALWALITQLRPPTGMVIGSRWLPGAAVNTPQARSRRMASRSLNRLVRFGFGLPFTDTQCGAKAIRREALDAVLPRLGATDWAFDIDLIFQVRRAGFPVREHPTTWDDVAGSTLRLPRASLEILGALLRLRLLHSPARGLVHLWDRTLGVRLYRRRIARLRAIYGTGSP